VRIVGGKWAGRQLVSPGVRVRPTAEGVRAAWLDVLGARVPGARVLDLFAGSGALGLEALSRGAAEVDFVENGPASLHALKANIAALRVSDRARVFKKDALPFAASLPAGRYSLAFADPPYGSAMLDRLLELWLAAPFADVLSVEHAADHRLPGGGRRYLFEGTAITFLPFTAVPPQRTRAPVPPSDRPRPRPPRRRR
jgi:16S rRNA (guanine966-N2)-methyltransferase